MADIDVRPDNHLGMYYATYRDDNGYLRGLPGHVVIGPPVWLEGLEDRLIALEAKIDKILEELADA